MKIHYKRYSIFIIIAYFTFFYPVYFNTSGLGEICDMLYNFLLAVSLVIVSYKFSKKPRTFGKQISVSGIYWIVAYVVVNIVSSAINGVLTINTTKTMLAITIICLLSTYLCYTNSERFIYSLEFAVATLVIANLITQVLYPDGLYQDGGTSKWLLGQKNQFMPYISVMLIVSAIRVTRFNNRVVDVRFIVLYLLGLLSNWLSASMTSVVLLIFVGIAVIVYIVSFSHISVNLKVLLPLIAVFCIVAVSGSETWVGRFASDFLGKDVTFTGRTLIWETVLLHIISSPIFGQGYLTGDQMAMLIDGNIWSARRSAHNMYLQFLFDGGIILLAVMIAFFYSISRKIIHEENKNYVFLMSTLLVMMLINGIFESTCRTVLFWLGMQIFFLSSTIHEK